MSHPYRLLLLEDDKAFAGALCHVLNKQNLYSKPIEIRSFSYQEYALQFKEHRNSTREIIILGGCAAYNFEPDTALLHVLLSQQERTHIFALVPSLAHSNTLQLWQPGVSGIAERNETCKIWLVKALQRLQLKQQPSKSVKGRQVYGEPRSASKGFLSHLKTALFSIFM
jgi:hypothetical protein